MTRQIVEDLYDTANRMSPQVVEKMKSRKDDESNQVPWTVHYEIPAETNEWTYVGNQGALSVTHSWVADLSGDTESVTVHHQGTHPQDETPDVCRVYYTPDTNQPTKRVIVHQVEGQEYTTPLWVRKRMFWECVEFAINWMEENSPGTVDVSPEEIEYAAMSIDDVR